MVHMVRNPLEVAEFARAPRQHESRRCRAAVAAARSGQRGLDAHPQPGHRHLCFLAQGLAHHARADNRHTTGDLALRDRRCRRPSRTIPRSRSPSSRALGRGRAPRSHASRLDGRGVFGPARARKQSRFQGGDDDARLHSPGVQPCRPDPSRAAGRRPAFIRKAAGCRRCRARAGSLSSAGSARRAETRAAQLGAALEERDQRIAGLGTVIEARSAEVQGLAASAAEREREAVELRAALGEARDSAAASVAERERATTELRAALDAAEARARDSAASLVERERSTAELRAALEPPRRGRGTVQRRLRSANGPLQSCELLLTPPRQGRGTVQRRLRSASERQQTCNRRCATPRRGPGQIAESVAGREQESAALKAALRIAETRALRLVAALEESGRRIGGLDGALRREKHEAEQLAARLAEREAEGENLRATLSAAEKALSASEKEVAEIQALAEKRARRLESEKQALLQQADLGYQKLIDHFRSSTSWKVTRPLRALKDWLPHASFRPRRPRLRLRKAKGRSGAAAIIEESGLFNEQYYLSFFRDETIGDPIGHYLQHGSKKGIDPNPLVRLRLLHHAVRRSSGRDHESVRSLHPVRRPPGVRSLAAVSDRLLSPIQPRRSDKRHQSAAALPEVRPHRRPHAHRCRSGRVQCAGFANASARPCKPRQRSVRCQSLRRIVSGDRRCDWTRRRERWRATSRPGAAPRGGLPRSARSSGH